MNVIRHDHISAGRHIALFSSMTEVTEGFVDLVARKQWQTPIGVKGNEVEGTN